MSHRYHSILAALLVFSASIFSCSGDPAVEVPKLIKQLQSRESGERNRAALKLASFGSDAKKAVPPLVRLLSDTNGGVRSSAAYALREIDTPQARKALDSYEKE